MNITESRKAREKQEREELIVEHADHLIRAKGYLGFNLDDLALQIEYSKGVLYKHFCSKEDIALAVVARHLQMRADLFSRGASLEGMSRERISGIGMADAILSKLAPHAFTLAQFVETPSVWEKTSKRIQNLIHDNGEVVGEIGLSVIRSGRETGDIPKNAPPDHHIMTGLICLSKGAHLLAHGNTFQFQGLNEQAMSILRDNYRLYLDGVGWRPLSSDWDYGKTNQRLRDEIFAKELKQLEG